MKWAYNGNIDVLEPVYFHSAYFLPKAIFYCFNLEIKHTFSLRGECFSSAIKGHILPCASISFSVNMKSSHFNQNYLTSKNFSRGLIS